MTTETTQYTADEIDESFEFVSGYEFDATITDVFAGYREQKGEKLLAIFELKSDDGEDREQWYTVGAGFDPSGDGTKLVPLNPRRDRLSEQSNYATFCRAAIELDGVRDVIRGRGPSTTVTIWKGLRFTFANKEFTNGKAGADEIKWKVLLPVDFLGVEGQDNTTDTTGAGNADNNRIRDALEKVAQSSADAAEFAERALVEVPGVEGDDDWSRKILSADFYNELKNG